MVGLFGGAAFAGRPASEFNLFTMLNGHRIRWTLPDGGASGLFAASGTTCFTFTPAQQQVLLFVPELPVNVCIRPDSTGVAWDGGCNLTTTDPNLGDPLLPWVPWFEVVDPQATTICGISDAGVVRTPIWRMY